MLIKQPSPMVEGYASVWIGPHRLEIDLPPEFGNCPPPTQNRDAFSPQPSEMKDPLSLSVYHDSR